MLDFLPNADGTYDGFFSALRHWLAAEAELRANYEKIEDCYSPGYVLERSAEKERETRDAAALALKHLVRHEVCSVLKFVLDRESKELKIIGSIRGEQNEERS